LMMMTVSCRLRLLYVGGSDKARLACWGDLLAKAQDCC